MIAEYSPNIAWGKQRVEIVLMQWAYSKKVEVEIGGNCTGFSVLDVAIDNFYDSLLPEGTDDEVSGRIVLTNENGDTLECSDDDDLGDEWLKNMVVSVQIVAYTPPTINEVRKMNGAKPIKDGDRPWQPL